MVDRIAHGDHKPIAHEPEPNHEVERTQFLQDSSNGIGIVAVLIEIEFVPWCQLAGEGEHEQFTSIDGLTAEGPGEFGPHLRGELQEHFDASELLRCRLRFCGLKTPDKVG